MDSDLEELETLSEIESLEKKLSDSSYKIADLIGHYEKLMERFSSIKSQGSATIAVPTSEELIAIFHPQEPSLASLSLYDSYTPERYLARSAAFVPTEIPKSEVEAEAEKQRERWRDTLSSTDRAILCGTVEQSEDSKENSMSINTDCNMRNIPTVEEVSLFNDQSPSEVDKVAAMDIEFTAELPNKVLVAPATEIKRSRRVLRSNQSDSTKRTRRSARF